jgi:hypothetical protein
MQHGTVRHMHSELLLEGHCRYCELQHGIYAHWHPVMVTQEANGCCKVTELLLMVRQPMREPSRQDKAATAQQAAL